MCIFCAETACCMVMCYAVVAIILFTIDGFEEKRDRSSTLERELFYMLSLMCTNI